MAKQQAPKAPVTPPKKKPATAGEGDAFSYLWRNLLIVAVLGLIFLIIFKANESIAHQRDLEYEYQQLIQRGGNEARLREIAEEYKQLPENKGFFKDFIRNYTSGYYWAAHDVALGSLKQINEINEKIESGQMKPLSYDDKMSYKVGLYPLIQHIRQNTPENAVIMLPLGDSVLSNTGKWNFVYDPDWMEYFLYPRLCLARGREKEYPALANRVTHVLIVQGKGYDLLKYDVPVDQRPSEAILPIDHPPAAPAQPTQPTQ